MPQEFCIYLQFAVFSLKSGRQFNHYLQVEICPETGLKQCVRRFVLCFAVMKIFRCSRRGIVAGVALDCRLFYVCSRICAREQTNLLTS